MKKAITLIIGTATALALASCSSESTSTPTASPTSTVTATTPAAAASSPAPTEDAAQVAAATPITITIGGTTIAATLNDSDAARDFIESMPVTVPSIRNAGIEYFGAVASPLTETGPFYDDVRPGDIVYYAPKDEVALIFKPTSSPGQLTKIGDITSDLNIFDGLPEDADIVYDLG
ncbi:cyclophilin-like fold protein [Pseudarthrobacter sp. MM222]|uniref:cyclophilin-like fold protein n=1 Tax=Pseudarthrobacter sp. MM222 TaxID=3018929 RepID=UPI00221F5903|nr:cyclophilin-like fold protein [Pseudarthrobacter sp. MM222]CAI3793691.1 hypothetical protein NKCBBBOE_00871 [Pseudarthrobacter sp. MM222]